MACLSREGELCFGQKPWDITSPTASPSRSPLGHALATHFDFIPIPHETGLVVTQLSIEDHSTSNQSPNGNRKISLTFSQCSFVKFFFSLIVMRYKQQKVYSLTTFEGTYWWHLIHLRCCSPSTFIHLQNCIIVPN